jgi:hypothetical protein
LPTGLVLFFLASCTGYSLTGGPGPLIKQPLSVEVSEKFNPARTNVVVVMPLATGATAELDQHTAEQLTEELIRAASAATSMEVVNSRAPEESKKAIEEVMAMPQPERTKAIVLGQKLAVDGVLFGVVNKYVDSSGGALGSNDPGAVSFKLWLVSPKSKEELWTATYEKHEQPLTDNLFRMGQDLRSGVHYESSLQLIRAGFLEAVRALEKARRKTPK